MRAAVLVHGGFHGGWCWQKVRERLTAAGWAVYAPSLTGLGDRAHLASPEVGLATHVQDVVALIETEELTEVVLCGHSAGGVVVTGVADRVPARIAHLVYLDAVVPGDGGSLSSVTGDAEGIPATFRAQAAEAGDGWLVPPALFTAAAFGVTDPGDAAWVERRMTGHPLRAFEDGVTLAGGLASIPRTTYVRCDGFPIGWGERMVALAETSGWELERWSTGHDAMITEPDEVARVLMSGNL